MLGYLLTIKLLPPPVDLTGALTAMLIVQASLRGSFRAGMVRVVAVFTGISIAMVVGSIVGTYSTIYVASSLALQMGVRREHLLPTVREGPKDQL